MLYTKLIKKLRIYCGIRKNSTGGATKMLFGPPGIQSPAVGGRKAFRAHVVGVVVIEHVSAPRRLFETAQQRSPRCRVGAVYNGFLHICSHSVDEKRTATQPHHMNLLRHTPNTLHNQWAYRPRYRRHVQNKRFYRWGYRKR